MLALTTIKTDRLVLRPHHLGDLAGLTRFFTNPDCMKYILVPKEMQNPEGARRGLEILIQSYVSPQPIFALSIADPTSDDFWGFCQLWQYESRGTVELVYAVAPENQRLGIATEAAKAVTAYALSSPEIKQVVAFVVPENAASVRVVEKLRFRNTGQTIHHGRSSIRFCTGLED
jgi:ribosomal-protein-alanine N-acetyltransferase